MPACKEKYLENVKKIAEESLDWKKLGPVVAPYRKLMEKELRLDIAQVESPEGFQSRRPTKYLAAVDRARDAAACVCRRTAKIPDGLQRAVTITEDLRCGV